jgi:hypothetical protein
MVDRSTGTLRSANRFRQQLSLLAFFLLVAGLVVLIPSNASSAGQNPIQHAGLTQKG